MRCFQLLLFAFGCHLFCPQPRNPSLCQQRCNWNSHTDVHGRRGGLDWRIRMSHESFDKLLALMCNNLCVEEVLARPRGGAVVPELSLLVTLRWLACGSHLDTCNIAGIGKASFCRALWRTTTALCKCEALVIVWPETRAQLTAAMAGFTSVSDNSAIANCIGVVGECLMRMKVPPRCSVGTVQAWFGGHRQHTSCVRPPQLFHLLCNCSTW